MPKMPEDFFLKKREEILDVAQKIALEKPLPHVSMKDIIRACGVSQGAIYHYFSSIDEIWLGLIERFYKADDVLTHLQSIISKPLLPEEVVCQCLSELCENLRRTIPIYGKLIMELNTMVQANPGQFDRMASSEATSGRLDKMLSIFEEWCLVQTQKGTIQIQGSSEQLLLYMSSSYLGLRYHAAAMYLQPSFSEEGFDAYLDLQLKTWQRTTLYLMGLGEPDENV